MQLAGFARVTLAPGEEKEVRFRVAREQLQLFDASSRWVVEPGTFQVMVGASSRDIRLRGEMEVR
jgi:beta-glucosidase